MALNEGTGEQQLPGDVSVGKRAPRVARWSLIAVAAVLVLVAASVVSLIALDAGSQQVAPAAESAEAAVLRWGDDPGAVYDRAVVVTPTPAPATPSPTPSPTPLPVSPFENAPYHMLIDAIGVNAPVLPHGLDANSVPTVPYNAYEVAWYTFSAQPGTGGNAVFAGHVTWSGQAVFYRLNQLATGDRVVLQGDDGAELTYEVEESFLVDPNDPDALWVMGPASEDMITIITCDGEFFYTNNGIGGDYTHRRVIRAGLTDVNLVSAGAAAGGG